MKPVTVSVILMALLLTKHSMSAAPTVCSGSRDVTVQISKSDIVRTWQPDGDCQRWQNGRSETNRFPAAVRSGPRWLVMQLRQPMVLDRVSVRGWDGDEWQAAGAVGSPVSVVGAASLPLELQLEDPCNASWEAFGRSGHWSRIEKTLVSFLLFQSSTSVNWKSVYLTGCHPSLRASSDKFTHDLLFLKEENRRTFELIDDSGSNRSNVICYVNKTYSEVVSNRVKLVEVVSSRPRRFQLNLVPELDWQGSELTCCYSDGHGFKSFCPIVNSIGVAFIAKHTQLDAPRVWLVNRTVAIKFSTIEEYPVSKHFCVLQSKSKNGQTQALTFLAKSSTVTKSSSGKACYTTVSLFEMKTEQVFQGREIDCRSTMPWSIATLYRKFNVDSLEPCKADLILSSKPHLIENQDEDIIHLTTVGCKASSHHCELIDVTNTNTIHLHRTNLNISSSIHTIRVRRSMGNRDWRAKCRFIQPVELIDMVQSELKTWVVFFQGKLNIELKPSMYSTNGLQWSVRTDDGLPKVTNLSCTLNNVKISSGKPTDSEFRFEAQQKINCVGQQISEGVEIFRLYNSKMLTNKKSTRLSSDKNHNGNEGIPIEVKNLLSKNSCEALRLLLISVVFTALVCIACVIICALIMVRKLSQRYQKTTRPRACQCMHLRDRERPLPQRPSSSNIGKYYYDEAGEPYSQIGSCWKSPYVNTSE